MHQLKENTRPGLLNSFDNEPGETSQEMRHGSAYLKKTQWQYISEKADEEDISKNQALRNLLDEAMEEDKR